MKKRRKEKVSSYLSYLRTGALYRERYKSTSCQSFSWFEIPFGLLFFRLTALSIIAPPTFLDADGEKKEGCMRVRKLGGRILRGAGLKYRKEDCIMGMLVKNEALTGFMIIIITAFFVGAVLSSLPQETLAERAILNADEIPGD